MDFMSAIWRQFAIKSLPVTVSKLYQWCYCITSARVIINLIKYKLVHILVTINTLYILVKLTSAVKFNMPGTKTQLRHQSYISGEPPLLRIIHQNNSPMYIDKLTEWKNLTLICVLHNWTETFYSESPLIAKRACQEQTLQAHYVQYFYRYHAEGSRKCIAIILW